MKSTRCGFSLALALVPLCLPAQPVPASAPPARLGSTVFQWENLAVRPTGNGVRRDVTDGPTASYDVSAW